jgi:hypothetical protein
MNSPLQDGLQASRLFRLDQEPEKGLGDVEILIEPEPRVVGAPELVHQDRFAPGYDDFLVGRIVEVNLRGGGQGNLLEAADADTLTADIPEMTRVAVILNKNLNFDEDLKKGAKNFGFLAGSLDSFMSLWGGDWLNTGFSVLRKWFADSTRIIHAVYLLHHQPCVSGHVVIRVIRVIPSTCPAFRGYRLPASG